MLKTWQYLLIQAATTLDHIQHVKHPANRLSMIISSLCCSNLELQQVASSKDAPQDIKLMKSIHSLKPSTLEKHLLFV